MGPAVPRAPAVDTTRSEAAPASRGSPGEFDFGVAPFDRLTAVERDTAYVLVHRADTDVGPGVTEPFRRHRPA